MVVAPAEEFMSVIKWSRVHGLSPQEVYYWSNNRGLPTYGKAPKRVKVSEADEWLGQRTHRKSTIGEFFIRREPSGVPLMIGRVEGASETHVVLETAFDRSVVLRNTFERAIIKGYYAIVNYEFVVRMLATSLRNNGRSDLADQLEELEIVRLNRPAE